MPMPPDFSIAAGHQLVLLHLGNAKGDLLGAHLRIRFTDQAVAGAGSCR